jgi:hypothetical protein
MGKLRIAAFAAALMATPALAQPANELTLYSNGHFGGARYGVSGPTQHMQVPYTIKSISVPPGTDWELCTGNTFTHCKRFSKSVEATAINVRSARPVGTSAVVGGVVTATGGIAPAGPSPSLRGMASEYFVAPEVGGRRIEVKGGTPDAMNRAGADFCRSIGWHASAHAGVQPVNATAFLVDVLCV